MAQTLPINALAIRGLAAVSVVRDALLAAGAFASAVTNRYRAARALSSFDRRMLADIGLTPGDVDSAFAEPIWRDPTRRLAVIAIERRAAIRARRLKHAPAAVRTEAEFC